MAKIPGYLVGLGLELVPLAYVNADCEDVLIKLHCWDHLLWLAGGEGT